MLISGSKSMVSNTLETADHTYDPSTDKCAGVQRVRHYLRGLPDSIEVVETENQIQVNTSGNGFQVCFVVEKDRLTDTTSAIPAHKILFIHRDGQLCLDLRQVISEFNEGKELKVDIQMTSEEGLDKFSDVRCPLPQTITDIFGLVHELAHHVTALYSAVEEQDLQLRFLSRLALKVYRERSSWDLATTILQTMREQNYVDYEDDDLETHIQFCLEDYEKNNSPRLGWLEGRDPRLHFTPEARSRAERRTPINSLARARISLSIRNLDRLK